MKIGQSWNQGKIVQIFRCLGSIVKVLSRLQRNWMSNHYASLPQFSIASDLSPSLPSGRTKRETKPNTNQKPPERTVHKNTINSQPHAQSRAYLYRAVSCIRTCSWKLTRQFINRPHVAQGSISKPYPMTDSRHDDHKLNASLVLHRFVSQWKANF